MEFLDREKEKRQIPTRFLSFDRWNPLVHLIFQLGEFISKRFRKKNGKSPDVFFNLGFRLLEPSGSPHFPYCLWTEKVEIRYLGKVKDIWDYLADSNNFWCFGMRNGKRPGVFWIMVFLLLEPSGSPHFPFCLDSWKVKDIGWFYWQYMIETIQSVRKEQTNSFS